MKMKKEKLVIIAFLGLMFIGLIINAISSHDWILLLFVIAGMIFMSNVVKMIFMRLDEAAEQEPSKLEAPAPAPAPAPAQANAVPSCDTAVPAPGSAAQVPPHLQHAYAILTAIAAKDKKLLTKAEDRLQEVLDLSRLRHE